MVNATHRQFITMASNIRSNYFSHTTSIVFHLEREVKWKLANRLVSPCDDSFFPLFWTAFFISMGT